MSLPNDPRLTPSQERARVKREAAAAAEAERLRLTRRRKCPSCGRLGCKGRPERLTDEKVKLFEALLAKLCYEAGVVFDHEDGHGSGRIRLVCPGESTACEIGVYAK